jgi:hypothetical protein
VPPLPLPLPLTCIDLPFFGHELFKIIFAGFDTCSKSGCLRFKGIAAVKTKLVALNGAIF